VASSEVLAAVSTTLVARLTTGVSDLSNPSPRVALDDLSSTPASDPPLLTLFLYDVVEDATLRNRGKTSELVGGRLVERKQPLSLCLHYMITAWAGDRVAEQALLGRVLQLLYDDAILDGLELLGVLAGTDHELRVSLSPMQLEDRARVWWAISLPYRLSLNYEVRVVAIDATVTDSATPVQTRDLAVGVRT
jgi:hypothetical protein